MMQNSKYRQFRHYIYNILQNRDYESRLSDYVDYFLVFLIVGNVIAVILESVDTIFYQYKDLFEAFESFSIAVFTLEYLLRLWVVVEKLPNSPAWKQRYLWIKSPFAIIDLLAILPAFIGALFNVDLRFIRILRLFRLLKLTRYFSSLRILLIVFKKEQGSFQAVLFILMMMIVTAASGMYLAENQAQPEEFESIPRAMWWAVVTLTTVGYGDVTPVTDAGKIFGAIITILGVGFAALPAGILASGLASELQYRREELEQNFREMLLEENIDLVHNQIKIERMRKELGLTKEQAQDIVLQVLREQSLEKREKKIDNINYCPHCGKSLH